MNIYINIKQTLNYIKIYIIMIQSLHKYTKLAMPITGFNTSIALTYFAPSNYLFALFLPFITVFSLASFASSAFSRAIFIFSVQLFSI
uniref:Uncharacterized protein n=1 Tax=Gossypium raimondii TaxID=29730 RepID=A0A0D2TWW9_GOSRA|nr:hypothetical protein B456_009G288300 [Gossypium raimondii]